MVARLVFGPDGAPVNRPSDTVAQEIGFHRAQLERLEALSYPAPPALKAIAWHREQIAQWQRSDGREG